MKYSVVRPELPVLWIDTHAVTALSNAYSKTESTDPTVISNRNILDRLRDLRRAGKIFVFETDQMREIEVKADLEDAARTVLAQLTLGVRSSYVNIQDNQVYKGMDAAIAKLDSLDLDFASAFHGDPFAQEQHGKFIVGARIEPDRKAITQRLASNKEISDKWEQIRASADKKVSAAIRRQKQWDLERLARQNVFRNAYISMHEPKDTDDLFSQIDSVSLPLTFWKSKVGDPSPDALYSFYGSEYYTNLPHVNIFSGLAAYKVTGNEKIKPSDIADLNNISCVMPYCSHMILDRAMMHAVREIGFADKYDVKLLRLNQVLDEFSPILIPNAKDNN